MKKLLVLTALVTLLATPALALSIKDTAHDLSGKFGTQTDEICIFCHTPHNALENTAAPLWNHTVTTQTFDSYASDTLTATGLTPGAESKTCLSCHDGVTGVNAFQGNTATPVLITNTTTFTLGTGNIGTALTNDHPVGFTYDSDLAIADKGLYAPSSPSGLTGGTTIAADMLFSGKMECASCHDVHDNAVEPFLIKSNADSGLCLTCHDK